tara:strand:- start:362 stop:1957 length:1596 start_codon:yes stop_codon:yes gene_type:complete
MSFELRDYQQDLVDKINSSDSKRNCVQLSTGGGKTIIFSYLANNFNGRVLILVNRSELLEQAIKNINRDCSTIEAGTTTILSTSVTLAMVESFYNRQKKQLVDINDYDLIIVDEVQSLEFVKVFKDYKNRLLGFTATPVIDKKEYYFKCRYCDSKNELKTECCGSVPHEYSSSVTLKRYYGDLIVGAPISFLIENDHLTNVRDFICDSPKLDSLKTDKSGQFTAKSEEESFDNFASLDNLILNYKEYCEGIKTMVFNSNIKTNKDACDKFVQLGYNARSYDSKSSEDRSEIVDWFRNTPCAVLMSVGVFTTGFDVDDVQAIIMNKATNSLSLYHQIVGRGGRTTNKIYKPYFKFIDLGGNVSRFGSWSEDVNWGNLYGDELEKKKMFRDIEDFKTCSSCTAMIKSFPCGYCGVKEPDKKERVITTNVAIESKKMPPPKPEHILNYAIECNLDINKAKVLTANYILDMFISSRTSKTKVVEQKEYLSFKIREIIKPIYFALVNSELEGNRKRTIKDFENKVKAKIEKYYESK